MKNISQLISSFGIIILTLLALSIGPTHLDSAEYPTITDDILRSKVAFAIIDEEIARHLNLGVLSEQDTWKLRGPVLLKIRTEIHYQLRKHFDKIVNTVDFGAQSGSGSPSESSSLNHGFKPVLYKKAAEIIRDFIAEKHISVIIMSDGPIGIGEASVIQRLRGDVRYTYEIINGACVSVPINKLTALIRRPFITEIWPDSKGNLELSDSVQSIGVDKVHTPPSGGPGVTGAGVHVAVVDTGIDPSHTEFQGRIIDKRDPNNVGRITDEHGTHVAGVIGSAKGVAPKVKFLDARLYKPKTLLNYIFQHEAYYSDAIDAIKWASNKKWYKNANKKADIINLSVAWPIWKYGRSGNDPMSKLIDEVVSEGIVCVVAAGNFAKHRAIGNIVPNSKPSHSFELKVSGKGTVTLLFTLLWDDKGNDLDLVILNSKGQEITESRSNPGILLGKTYKDKPDYGRTKYYEQVEYTFKNQSIETYRFQVEAAKVQVSQKYEVLIGGKDTDYACFIKPNPEQTISVPGYSERAITVGALADDFTPADFSSHGPSDTNLIKPEIVAPGENIESTVFSPPSYDDGSGTSVAAPHVAGVAALILEAVGKNSNGEWNFSPDEVKSAIVRGAQRNIGGIPNTPNNRYGAGLVKADNIIFGGTVKPNNSERYEIKLLLTRSVFGNYTLNADSSLNVAVSWQETTDNLDIVLADAQDNILFQSKETATNYEKISGTHMPIQGALCYLYVQNRSQKPVDFTGASTYPIEKLKSISGFGPTSVQVSVNEPSSETSNLSSPTDFTQESRLRATLKEHTDFVSSVAFSPDGQTLASGSWDNTIRLWNPHTEQPELILKGHTNNVTSVAFSANGVRLMSGSMDKTVGYWDPTTGKLVKSTYDKYRSNETFTSVVYADAAGDHYWSASGSTDNLIWLWKGYGDVAYPAYYKLGGHTQDVSSVDFSADERTLASGSHDHTIKLWYVENRKLRATLKGHTDFVSTVAFSPHGQTLASGSWDNTIRLWDVATGKSVVTLSGHTDRVLAVAFSPNGRTLASGSDDQTIRLWDVATGRQKDMLLGHTNGITSLAFSPDSRTLASAGGWDNTIRLWDISPAPTPAPTVRITPSLIVSPAVGDNLVVNVNISGVQNVAGYQTTVRFDSTALHYVESANGTYLPTGSLFVPPVINANQVTLAAASLSGDSDGAGTLATLTFEVVAVKPSSITLSDVMIMEQDLTSIPIIVKGADVVVLSAKTLDVNGDGVVDIQDLTIVATHFGTTGTNQADINNDNIVDIKDLLLVAGGINTAAAAPLAYSKAISMLTVEDIQDWLSQASQLDLNDATYQKGIAVLQQLLAALTPKETALLPNYPNPFNPETWIPYQLANAADVTLTIYAVDGTAVRTLALGHQPIGIYQGKNRAAYWDGKNALGEPVASGVYFYTLTAGDFTATRKMLIRK